VNFFHPQNFVSECFSLMDFSIALSEWKHLFNTLWFGIITKSRKIKIPNTQNLKNSEFYMFWNEIWQRWISFPLAIYFWWWLTFPFTKYQKTLSRVVWFLVIFFHGVEFVISQGAFRTYVRTSRRLNACLAGLLIWKPRSSSDILWKNISLLYGIAIISIII
jgi:hypothetical protein